MRFLSKSMKKLIKVLYICFLILIHPITGMEFLIRACINIAEFFSLVRMLLSNHYNSSNFNNKLKQQEEEKQGQELVALIEHNIKSKKKNIPWLQLPTKDGPPSLLSLSEEARLYNLNMPKEIKGRGGGHCCGSSNGWLAIITTPMSDFYPQLFLWNPLIDHTKTPPLQLPSLTTIPRFIGFINCLPKKYNASKFIDKIDISMSTSTSTMVVAMLCNSKRTLAYCTPGDKRWTVYKHNNNEEDADVDVVCLDILFINNTLYTLSILTQEDQQMEAQGIAIATTNSAEGIATDIFTCLANTSNEFQVVVRSIKHAPKYGTFCYEVFDDGAGFVIAKKYRSCYCLVESIQGEVLMIRRDLDYYMKEEDVCMPELATTYTLQLPALKYGRTRSFKVYKFNATRSNSSTVVFDKLSSLEDQALFYSEYGCVSVPAKEFGQGNCVYFVALPDYNVLDHSPKVSREAGVFYLEDGTIKRHLPSFKLPAQSHPCWLMPNSDISESDGLL